MEEYPIHRRGGKGVINIRLKHGDVVSSKCIDKDDEILVITEKGIMIRIKAEDVSIIGRSTQGVRVIRVENDSVVDIAKISD